MAINSQFVASLSRDTYLVLIADGDNYFSAATAIRGIVDATNPGVAFGDIRCAPLGVRSRRLLVKFRVVLRTAGGADLPETGTLTITLNPTPTTTERVVIGVAYVDETTKIR